MVKAAFGPEIFAVCKLRPNLEPFFAGFVGVECGKKRVGKETKFNPDATRFEGHVLEKLKALRDGKKRLYQGLTPSAVAGKTDLELRVLATSHGPTQIMGFHTLKALRDYSIEDLSRPGRRFSATYDLLLKVAIADVVSGHWERVLRTWNSGEPTGETHDPDYVFNALAVMEAYRQIPGAAASTPAAILPDPLIVTPGPQAGPSDPGREPGTDPDPGSWDTSLGEVDESLSKVASFGQRVADASTGVKSIWAVLFGSTVQLFAMIAGWATSTPRIVLLAVLGFVGLLCLAYLVRQIILGFMREKSKN